jgi:hypothetical protein
MGEHTPGPWSVPHFAEPDTNCNCGYVLCDHLMGAVATVHCSGEGADWQKHGDNPKFAEAVANARLIAAAPDMYEALKALVAQILDYEKVNNLSPNPGRKYCWDNTERAVAAIAKAEGASSDMTD